ncbi:MAG: ABC transporter substrate-binding protein [Pseudomonadota bacterium]
MRFPKVWAVVLLLAACTQSRPAAQKEISYPLSSDIQGFDPIHSRDTFTSIAVSQVYQGLLKYKYLARPYGVEPLLAEKMPSVSSDGLTYTFRIRDGAFFHDDAVFGGVPRPLRASDFVYSFKRLADPENQAPQWWVLEGRITGLDEFRERLKAFRGTDPYREIDVAGLSAPDEKTLVVKLKKPYRRLPFILAMAPTVAVPREIVEAYGKEFLNHPVGTGPFILKEWRRGQKIVFEKNPKYWSETYPSEGEPGDRGLGLLEAAGRPLPFVDRVTFWIYVESQPAWLNFLKGKLDLGTIPKDAFETVFDPGGKLRDEMAAKGIMSRVSKQSDLVMFVFNLNDPLLGQNPFLRKAISCAIDRERLIRTFYNGRAIAARGPIPPDIFGYDPKLKDPNGYDPARAREFLERARDLERKRGKNGKIPAIVQDIENSASARQMAEAVTADLKKVGLSSEIRVSTWPQLQQRQAKGDVQFVLYSWVADYPDPENFLRLLYGQNVSPGPNAANFKNAAYDRMFEKMQNLPNNAERAALITKMVSLVHQETPWVFLGHRMAYTIRHSWLKNFKRNEMSPAQIKYLDVDPDKKRETLPKL